MDIRPIIEGIASRIPFYGKKLNQRTKFTEVGAISGHVSMMDEAVAKERKLEPLNAFERWFMQPRIDKQKQYNQNIFRQACINVMGEDPNEDGYIDDPEYDAEISRMYASVLGPRFG